MRQFSTIFNQLLQLIPRRELERLIKKYQGDRYSKHLGVYNLLVTHLFSQVRGKDSLRDIETSFRQHSGKWFHLGIQSIARSTISDANNRIDHRIFEGLFYEFLSKCTDLSGKKKFKFKNPLYALDATIVDLCLSLFEWAKFRKTKGAIKLHCLLDIKGAIPTFLVMTNGKVHEATVAQNEPFPLLPDSIITFDRGYIDFGVFSAYQTNGVFFVTRAKSSLKYTVVGQQALPNRKGLLFDKTILLSNHYQRLDYPDTLRLIGFQDPETGKIYEFLTNNFKLAAATIANIYKARWEIELFFKWIKQNLKIKSFLGTSKNALMSQVWTAMIYFLLLSYLKYQTKYRFSLLNLARILQETLFHRTSLINLLSIKSDELTKIRDPVFQPALF